MAEISVIVPVYNAGEFVGACIESVVSQTFADWELLLVDDGSTDGSNAICRRYASADQRIKLIEQPNGGVSSARNAGLDRASGRYVAFLDADDAFFPDTLSVLYGAAEGDDIDITIGKWIREINKPSENQRLREVTGRENPKVSMIEPVRFCADMLYRKSYADSTVCGRLFLRSLFDGIRFYDGKYEDLEILPRLILKARKIGLVDRLVYFYRDNPRSFINTWAENRKDAVKVTRKIMETFIDGDMLGRAALNRHFRANYNLLLELLRNCPGDRPEIQKCYDEIKRLRRTALTDVESRLSTRLGALISYGGLSAVSLLAKYFKK